MVSISGVTILLALCIVSIFPLHCCAKEKIWYYKWTLTLNLIHYKLFCYRLWCSICLNTLKKSSFQTNLILDLYCKIYCLHNVLTNLHCRLSLPLQWLRKVLKALNQLPRLWRAQKWQPRSFQRPLQLRNLPEEVPKGQPVLHLHTSVPF